MKDNSLNYFISLLLFWIAIEIFNYMINYIKYYKLFASNKYMFMRDLEIFYLNNEWSLNYFILLLLFWIATDRNF